MVWICKKDCGNCCGCVPFTLEVIEKHKDKFQREVIETLPAGEDEVVVVSNTGMCVFLKEDKSCAIYEDRPDVCRKYGVHPDLPCPYIKPNGNPRSPAQVRRWQRIINKQVDSQLKNIDKVLEARRCLK